MHSPDWSPLATVQVAGGGSVLLITCQDCGVVSAEGDAWRTHLAWHRSRDSAGGDASASRFPSRAGW